MKILIIMGGYFPGKKFGGPPVSVNNFCDLMSDYECYIITKNHDMGSKQPYTDIKDGWNKVNNANVLYLKDEEYNKSFFEKALFDLKPDVLYLQGLYQRCVLPCLQLAKKHKVKVLLATRGELCRGAFKKKYKKIPYIMCLRAFGLLKNINFQTTSDEEICGLRRMIGADEGRIFYLPNIPSIAPKIDHTRIKEAGEAKVVFMARIVSNKNLCYAIQRMNNIKGKVQFDIYGSMEDTSYWQECESAIKELPPNIKVNYCGLIGHDKVHETFAQYDTFLFPTLSENYGHSIIESVSSGCCVIISDKTPWNDAQIYNAGMVNALDDEESFEASIQKIVDENAEKAKKRRNDCLHYAQLKLNFAKIREEYNNVFQTLK